METETDNQEMTDAEREIVSQAMKIIGRKKTPKRKAAHRRNIKHAQEANRRRPYRLKPLLDCECRCGRGQVLEGHPMTCPRGQTIHSRIQKGLPLHWDKPSLTTDRVKHPDELVRTYRQTKNN